MRLLFFFVHPAKVHLFRRTIEELKSRGHRVEILIISKDLLETLVVGEGWEYKNIFPEGRKMKGVPAYVSSGINFFRTLYRLFKYTKGKKYDLFVTDDLLVYLGKLKKIPTIVFTDDDLRIAKQFALVLGMADHILSPDITDLGKYSAKKIGFPGYKELAYLHPNQFVPDIRVVKKYIPDMAPYFVLRLVSLRSYHDVGMKGLSNENVLRLIELLEKRGKVLISAERPLPEDFEKYRLHINPLEIAHVLYYAQMFIGDSQTMTSEAAVLGTPAFRCNDFAGKIKVMEEKETKYGLSFNYPPARFDDMYKKIEELLSKNDLKETFRAKRALMLQDKIDVSAFLIWFLEKYPDSVRQYKADKSLFSSFKIAGSDIARLI